MRASCDSSSVYRLGNTAPGAHRKTRRPRAARRTIATTEYTAICREPLEEPAIDADRRPRLVRAEIAKHVEKIILTPEGRTYVASGTWDLLGSEAVTMVPGARIELATPAFSGRRSTSELPRHA